MTIFASSFIQSHMNNRFYSRLTFKYVIDLAVPRSTSLESFLILAERENSRHLIFVTCRSYKF